MNIEEKKEKKPQIHSKYFAKILAKNSLKEKKKRKFDRHTLPPAYPKISMDFSRNIKLQA